MNMKKAGVSLAAGWLALWAFAAQAAVPVSVVARGLPHHALMSIAFDGNAGVAVGNYGEIQTSGDGGKKWVREKLPAGTGLFGVDARNGLRVAVGQSGGIVVSRQGGRWEAVDSGLSDRLMAVSIGKEGMIVAAGGFGALTLSTDEGRSWTPLMPDWTTLMPNAGEGVVPHLYAVHVGDNGSITVAGEYSGIFRSFDRGVSWQVLHRATVVEPEQIGDPPPIPPSIFSLDVTSDGEIYAVGQEGLILHSSDDGCTFREAFLRTKSLLFAVKASPGGRAVSAGMYSMVYTTDGGKTWKNVDDPAIATSWYVGAADAPQRDGSFLLVGKAGTISKVKP